MQCTYGPTCKPSEEENLVSVLDFKNKHGQKGTVLNCFYNRNEHTEVILDNSAHKIVTFHVFFWPSCVFFLGVCMLIKVYCLKRTQTKQVFMPQDISFVKTDNNNVYNYHETNESPWQTTQKCCLNPAGQWYERHDLCVAGTKGNLVKTVTVNDRKFASCIIWIASNVFWKRLFLKFFTAKTKAHWTSELCINIVLPWCCCSVNSKAIRFPRPHSVLRPFTIKHRCGVWKTRRV